MLFAKSNSDSPAPLITILKFTQATSLSSDLKSNYQAPLNNLTILLLRKSFLITCELYIDLTIDKTIKSNNFVRIYQILNYLSMSLMYLINFYENDFSKFAIGVG